ncbi:MAG TPA: PAS domain-containing sensor histidine kinase [Gaiellaceae bacterium]|nr:PAS domain-containing sensor histidine kinase [Gaiellaceae bacterium]
MTSSERVVGRLDELGARLASSEDLLVLELLESLRTTVDQLRTIEEELERRNDELLDAHAAVAAEASRFGVLFDEAPIAYLVTDRAGVITEANAAATVATGRAARFLRGKPLATLVEIRDRRELRRRLLQLHDSGGRAEFALRMRRARGVAFDVRVSAALCGDSVLWAIVDESAARQAEEQLWELNRELEERVAERTVELETVIDEIPVGLVLVGSDGRVARANSHARAILGEQPAGHLVSNWPLRTADGMPLAEADRPALRALRGQAVSGERLLLEDVLLHVNAVPIRDGGRVTGAVITFEDVTELERRSRADREFVTNAAHQLRNPITAIASVVAALQVGARHDPSTLDQFVAHIERETARMTRTVESLLRLARLEREGRAPELRLTPLRPLLEGVADAANVPSGVAVTVTGEPDVAAMTNDGLVFEILENLVANALAHTPRGSVELGAAFADGRAVVEVSDDGPGIRPGDEKMIFERFFSGSGRGAGLGLAIARRAAAAVGGELVYAGSTRGGATFRLTLPGARIVT